MGDKTIIMLILFLIEVFSIVFRTKPVELRIETPRRLKCLLIYTLEIISY